MKYKALDLFCGGGGACVGLQQAGFEVTGIDIKNCPNYPGKFIKGDATNPTSLGINIKDYDFIWASPPCQKFSVVNFPNRKKGANVSKVDLISNTRKLLASHPVTCIENVPLAPIRPDIKLAGPMFGELKVIRKRHFEISWFCLTHQINRATKTVQSGDLLCVTTGAQPCFTHLYEGRINKGLPIAYSVQEKKDALGITHEMNHRELGESIPPAYSNYIAKLAIDEIKRLANEV